VGLEEIEAFKAGLRKTESKSWEGDPMRRGLWKDGDGEVGSYGVRASNFAYWASEVGLAGADWQDAEVMEIVVTNKITQYYEQYQDWDLVAMAWLGGTDLADAVASEPVARSTNGFEGRSVGDMADEITTNMGQAPEEVAGLPAPPDMPYTPSVKPKSKLTTQEVDAKTQLVTMFDQWGTDLAGGQRQDYRQIGVAEPPEVPE